ncbi:MAG TPA: hypothetical protein VJT75_08170 [Thermoleophilaceae bacterium]|nr:hypothetical protein [Thermoleophilaceae bacterium]
MQERYEDLAVELMPRAAAARDGLFAAVEALRAASGAWGHVRASWSLLAEGTGKVSPADRTVYRTRRFRRN